MTWQLASEAAKVAFVGAARADGAMLIAFSKAPATRFAVVNQATCRSRVLVLTFLLHNSFLREKGDFKVNFYMCIRGRT
jgi:hypothetical protein